ncbi:MAG: YjfK family protein [Desulfobulbaceae bacterium]|nr:YjfK family protein [Desulfobulbaceae bacterium]
MSLMNLGKRILKKKVEKMKGDKPKDRIDGILPMGIHMDAKVTLDETPFILADGLGFEFPGTDNLVKAFGTFDLLGGKFFRVYMNSEDEVSFLEIAMDNGEVAQCRLFRQIHELYPESLDDPEDMDPDADYWQHWIGKKGHMRSEEFIITNDDDSESVFGRVWENPGPAYIPPKEYTEQMHFDPCGENSEEVQCQAMLFGRLLSEEEYAIAEFLLIQSESDSDGARIVLYLGVDINPASLEII